MWQRFLLWLAREEMAYLKSENRALRCECDRWIGRYEGAMNAVKVLEARNNYMMQAIADSHSLDPMSPIILKKELP